VGPIFNNGGKQLIKGFVVSLAIVLLMGYCQAAQISGSGEFAITRVVTSSTTTTASVWSQLWTEGYEAMVDGEEWSNDGDWTEQGAITEFEADTAQYKVGSVSGLVDTDTANEYIYRAFTKTGEPVIRIDFAFRLDADNNYETFTFLYGGGMAGGNRLGCIGQDASNNLDWYEQVDNTWEEIMPAASWAINTWYYMTMTVDTSIATGVSSINFYWDTDAPSGDTAPFGQNTATDNPFDTDNGLDPTAFDRLSFKSSAVHVWIDDITVYED